MFYGIRYILIIIHFFLKKRSILILRYLQLKATNYIIFVRTTLIQ